MSDAPARPTGSCPKPPDGADARLAPRSASIARAAVQAAQRHLFVHAEPASVDGQPAPIRAPHPAAPEVGACSRVRREVLPTDAASAMGHPDGAMAVLGSPRISLWFELATTPLMPPIVDGLSHVGVAIFVHHLGVAAVGDAVELVTSVDDVNGRLVTFACHAYAHGGLIALGSHLRVIRDAALGIDPDEGNTGG